MAGAGGPEASDLARATHIAMRIESTCGLGHTGLLWLPADNPRELVLHRNLQAAVQRTLDRAHAAAKELLSANRAALEALAAALTERGYLDRDEINTLLAQVPLQTTTAGALSPQGAPPHVVIEDKATTTSPDGDAVGPAGAARV